MLQALYERDIRPELFVGTSAGALNAAFAAARPSTVDSAIELQRIWLGLTRSQVFPAMSRCARDRRSGARARANARAWLLASVHGRAPLAAGELHLGRSKQVRERSEMPPRRLGGSSSEGRGDKDVCICDLPVNPGPAAPPRGQLPRAISRQVRGPHGPFSFRGQSTGAYAVDNSRLCGVAELHLADRPRGEKVERGSPVPSTGGVDVAESVANALWSILVSADCQLPAELIGLDNGALSSCTSTLRRPGPAVRAHGRSASPGIRVSVLRTVRDAVAELLAQPKPAPPDAVLDPRLSDPRPHMSFGEGVLGSASSRKWSAPTLRRDRDHGSDLRSPRPQRNL
jgi:hypothetical protein